MVLWSEMEVCYDLVRYDGRFYCSMTGSYPLHYAASEGYDDVITVLLEKGANVMAWNNNGRTAVHQAAMHGHARSIVTLVAGGAVVRTLDHKGCLALEYAIKNKHVTAVKLLCQFGSEPLLQDWSWVSQRDLKKKKAEYEMAKILQHQIRLIPGYRHTGIIFDVARVTPEEGPILHLEQTGVEVKVVEGQEPYYLYLCQTEEAYGSPPTLGPDEETFGHLLECQTWGPRVQTITLIVTVDRVLRQNEEIVLRPAITSGGVEMQEDENVGITKVTITVPLVPTGITYFTMASREKKQVFKISEEAVVLKPESEPEAEIDIPAGTFDSGELSIKFVVPTDGPDEADDQDKKDQSKPKGEPVLMTSILDLSTTDGQMPKHDIQMKMPVTVADKSEAVVVLTTSNPDPNLEQWDWDEIPAEIDGAGKAVFTINHFSIFSGTSKPKLDANPEGVKDTVRNTFLKMRRVEFLVALKTPEMDESKTDMIITCGTKRKTKLVKKKYDSNYTWFNVGSDDNLKNVPEGQTFQIVIRGNLKEGSDDENMKLIFKSGDQESSRALEIVSTCPDPRELSGEVEIIKETKTRVPTDDKETVEQIDDGLFSCFSRSKSIKVTKAKSEVWEINTCTLCTIPFSTTLTKREPEPEPAEVAQNVIATRQTTSAPLPKKVTWDRLKDAVSHLSADESKQLGFQLGLNGSQMQKVEEDTMDEVDLAMNVIKRWHLLLAKNDMVSQLKGALEAIGRRDLIHKVTKE
ncbi:Ankyrin repeat protein [Mizuhopecten yessoensis]|uniref:Ankyrin repeat protein n=1 Tax=Mizuhopecten yessoensis TaxID=6573 RepID=A0A210PGM3_MIZYE|nr:Ankyrin repeat protein [Mizuhopecten yessoensis]